MRLLLEFFLGLVLLTPFSDAVGRPWLYYRVKGDFLCDNKPRRVMIRIVEHDPITNDVVEFWDTAFDHTGHDIDRILIPYDPLELSIHALFTCGHCQGQLYEYIPQTFQFREQEDADRNPLNFGSVELKNVCKLGKVDPWYSRYDKKILRKTWRVRDYKTKVRQYFKEIN